MDVRRRDSSHALVPPPGEPRLDIFLEGQEWLSVLSPRLNDTTDRVSVDYTEDSLYLKLTFPNGEVDFIVAPLLTMPGAVERVIRGHTIQVETPEEIIAKKLHFRGDQLRVRDVIDIAVVLAHAPDALWNTRHAWIGQAEATRRRLVVLRQRFDDEVVGLRLLPPGDRVRSHALNMVDDWIVKVMSR